MSYFTTVSCLGWWHRGSLESLEHIYWKLLISPSVCKHKNSHKFKQMKHSCTNSTFQPYYRLRMFSYLLQKCIHLFQLIRLGWNRWSETLLKPPLTISLFMGEVFTCQVFLTMLLMAQFWSAQVAEQLQSTLSQRPSSPAGDRRCMFLSLTSHFLSAFVIHD